MKNINPSKTSAWAKLTAHFEASKNVTIAEQFAKDSNRFNNFSIKLNDDFLVDFSKNRIDSEKNKLRTIEKSGALRDPLLKINDSRRNLIYLSERLTDLTQKSVDNNRIKYSRLVGKLDALSPLKVISRGYALVSSDNGIVKSRANINVGDKLKIELSDGSFNATVTEINGE
jgi:exonuclease VII large subunit